MSKICSYPNILEIFSMQFESVLKIHFENLRKTGHSCFKEWGNTFNYSGYGDG